MCIICKNYLQKKKKKKKSDPVKNMPKAING